MKKIFETTVMYLHYLTRRRFRKILFFLALYALPLAACGLDMALNHNYEVDAAMLLISAMAVMILMEHLHFEHLCRREPSVAAPSLKARERWAIDTIRILVALAGVAVVLVVGRGPLAFWTVITTITAELLTVFATQKIRIKRMLNIIITTYTES